jgi:hypothetical protein
MSTPLPPRVPSSIDWVRRCAARIRELDDVVSLLDAVDLASTLHELPCCASLDPETAAARLFQDNLTASRWGDIFRPCDPSP